MCVRVRDELIIDVLLWTPTHGRAKARRPARTYIQQLCEDTGCCPEDLPEVMNDREKWRERVRDIRATSTTWWWWRVCICVCVLLWACNIMAEGFRFVPLSLVRLRNFRLGAWVSREQHENRCSRTRAQSGRVTQRCYNSPRWKTGLHSASDVTHRKRAEDFGRFWKSQWVETRHRTSWDESCLRGRRLVFTCSQKPLWLVPHVLGARGGGRWKKPE